MQPSLSKTDTASSRGAALKAFMAAAQAHGKDIYIPAMTKELGVFDFRSFLNLAMLLTGSEKASALRMLMLDTVIELINRKNGCGTKQAGLHAASRCRGPEEPRQFDSDEERISWAFAELERLMLENQDVLMRLKEC